MEWWVIWFCRKSFLIYTDEVIGAAKPIKQALNLFINKEIEQHLMIWKVSGFNKGIMTTSATY